MKKIIILIIIISTAGGFYFFKKENTEKKALDTDTQLSQSGTIKSDFYLETKKISDFPKTVAIKKTGKIIGADDFILSSQANASVNKIYVKTGDSVYKGQIIASLSDNISSYGLNLERARNNLERSKLNYESTKISLEKAISDSQIAYDRADKDVYISEENIKERLEKAKYDYDQSDLDSDDSKAKLDLEKLENDLEKANIDYQNQILSNKKNLESFKENLKTINKGLILNYTDIINFCDELVGITDENKYKNYDFEVYLGAKDTKIKQDTELKLREVIKLETKLKELEFDLLSSDLDLKLKQIELGYDEIKILLDMNEELLKKSVVSTSFPETSIDLYLSNINTYQSTLQGSYSSFISLKNSIKSFLATYTDLEKSTSKSIEILEKQIDLTKRNLEIVKQTNKTNLDISIIDSKNTYKNVKLSLKTAQSNLETAKKNKEISLKQLENSIREAEISYNSALKEYSKLTIKSPINGKISEVLIDSGEEIKVGTALFNLVNNKKQEIEIGFSSKEITYIQVGMPIKINYKDIDLVGEILSISDMADENFNYIAKVGLNSELNLIGDLVEISFDIKTPKVFLPINIVKTLSDGKGKINTLNYNSGAIKIEEINIDLASSYDKYIELNSELNQDLELILNDVGNYDETKYELKIR